MTIAVLTASTTRTTRREPLKVIDMATSQARPAPSSESANGSKRGRRASARVNGQEDNVEDAKSLQTAKERSTRSAVEKKRKAEAYDEDIGGFQFTRGPTKKSKSGGDENVASGSNAAVQNSPKRGRPPKTKQSKTSGVATEDDAGLKNGAVNGKSSRGRPKRPSLELEGPPEKQLRSDRGRKEEEPFPMEKTGRKGRPKKSKAAEDNVFQSPEPSRTATSKITLPFADTPVIRRNKEMREERAGKGQRRSSLGMRGRRASSLIESGASNALPHKEVNTSDFYKHIACDGLSEPRRMKQLLTWCATRAMGDRPSGSRSDDDSARLAARVIQEELLQDFANRSELSDWFSREDAAPPTVIVKKPNPKNVQNIEKIKQLEEHILRLQNERHALNSLLRPPSIPSHSSLAPQNQLTGDAVPQDHYSLDGTVLDPSQKSILDAIGIQSLRIQPGTTRGQEPPSISPAAPILPDTVSSRVSRITTSLAPTLDSFSSGLHDIDIYRSAADSLSSRILHICSQRLEERDAQNTLRTQEIEGRDQDDNGGGESGSADRRSRLRIRQPKEDIGFVLGALSRVERR